MENRRKGVGHVKVCLGGVLLRKEVVADNDERFRINSMVIDVHMLFFDRTRLLGAWAARAKPLALKAMFECLIWRQTRENAKPGGSQGSQL